MTPGEIENSPQGVPIRLMSQATFQRSSLTVNNGRYYLDTGPSLAAQKAVNPPQHNISLFNVFRKGGKYYVFLVYAKTTTKQTYDIYVEAGFDKTKIDQLWQTRVKLRSAYEFHTPQPFPQDTATYDSSTGILTVTMDISKFPKFSTEYAAEQKNECQPTTFCQWIDSPEMGQDNCQRANSTFSPPTSTFQSAECSKTNGICHWGSEESDCPDGGCYGFGFKLRISL